MFVFALKCFTAGFVCGFAAVVGLLFFAVAKFAEPDDDDDQ